VKSLTSNLGSLNQGGLLHIMDICEALKEESMKNLHERSLQKPLNLEKTLKERKFH
jgi:hypothetical protein